ncbi:hypothetical protein KIPB_006956 [Kipferlia bialata]|uniref:Uncharacterized protein n=1 Tax=Kipferlia bialata TaxID=797122 RepID=A0A9K3CZL4_9EUKA|nr:hypothetical protein KIPB_006956 [Kipferlia bialata]|eukprot:g6956.t1
MQLRSLLLAALLALALCHVAEPEIDHISTDQIVCLAPPPMTAEMIAEREYYSLSATPVSPPDASPDHDHEDVEGYVKDIKIIVNIGKKVWGIVENGKTYFNYDADSAYIVPKGIDNCDEELEYWDTPEVLGYSTSWKSGDDHTMDFDWDVIFTPNGTYEGNGFFMSHVTIEPTHIWLAKHWQCNVEVDVMDPFPTGTTQHPVDTDPIAGVEIVMKIHNLYKNKDKGSWQYSWFVYGDGHWYMNPGPTKI